MQRAEGETINVQGTLIVLHPEEYFRNLFCCPDNALYGLLAA